MDSPEGPKEIASFWSKDAAYLFEKLATSFNGLTQAEASRRFEKHGGNELGKPPHTAVFIFLSQFKSPITILLIAAAILSFYLHDETNAVIILIIVFVSSTLSFWQEKNAGDAMKKLLSIVQTKATVLRDTKWKDIPINQLVPGDIIKLSAGDAVPADCFLLESNELFTDEAAFTGETFPVEKTTGVVPLDSTLNKRSNTVFMGSHITSGNAKALVVLTGLATEFGEISKRLKIAQPETDFEKGIRKLGYLLMEITATLVVVILFFNMLLHRPVLDSFLFALALAVGLTPQLLPAIISINLSKGAQEMARLDVIVKRLSSIENFGSMNVLCSDKTGTLTEGKVKLHETVDYNGKESSRVLFLASVNALLQQGYNNPIDEAIRDTAPKEALSIQRLDEIPYDFIRKRLSILAKLSEGNTLVIKGAFKEVLESCDKIQTEENKTADLKPYRNELLKLYQNFSENGFRTLAVASKPMPAVLDISKSDEKELIFEGFITLFDPVKSEAQEIITQLNQLGVNLKIITGDNALIAKQIAQQLGFEHPVILTGKEIRLMSTNAFVQKAARTHVFAEVEPNQKERIILSLKKSGNVVGYMGDGINDATALHAADVGISVNSAVDVAKEAADIVLLTKDLRVIINGIKEGRKVFLNTMKYIFMATSANFGNMFSMAGASLMLPFLPLLPKQILVTNLLTDFPEMTIATDQVDKDSASKPKKWSISFVTRFMIVFGLISSIFDYLTFGILIYALHAQQSEFQTGWFVESVVSASLIVLVLRTQKSILESRPSVYLLTATLLIVLFTLLLPLLPLAKLFGFIPLPWYFYGVMLLIVVIYILVAEAAKRIFYKHIKL